MVCKTDDTIKVWEAPGNCICLVLRTSSSSTSASIWHQTASIYTSLWCSWHQTFSSSAWLQTFTGSVSPTGCYRDSFRRGTAHMGSTRGVTHISAAGMQMSHAHQKMRGCCWMGLTSYNWHQKDWGAKRFSASRIRSAPASWCEEASGEPTRAHQGWLSAETGCIQGRESWKTAKEIGCDLHSQNTNLSAPACIQLHYLQNYKRIDWLFH